jgi:uncharacterized membrane protein YphA (DoxX/SURF4 family)
MYPILLAAHNLIRWFALIIGIVIVVLSFLGWFGKKEWSDRDRKWGMYYTISMDIQLLLGLLLYIVFSPITRAAFLDFGAAMSNSGLRFFAIEHALVMLLAVVFAHLGSVFSKKAQDSTGKFKRAALWYALSVLLLIAGMPWFRPLFPGL